MNYKFERVYVETPVDTDRDGWKDLIAVYIKRPDVSDQVPVLFCANPYMMFCNEDWYQTYDVNQELKAYPDIKNSQPQPRHPAETEPRGGQASQWTDQAPELDFFEMDAYSPIHDYFLGKGYASVFSGGLGTRGSQGLVLTGSKEEVLAFKAVIDWLNGRAPAYTDLDRKVQVRPSWTTGKVAMTGKSYLGTLATAVATTGVAGLETVIPEAAISNWYTYYRHGGLCLAPEGYQGDDLNILAKYCTSRAFDPEDFASIEDLYEESQADLIAGQDRESANYNAFWHERNYLKDVGKIKCSVFLVHGINDWNVKSKQAFDLLEELQAHEIPHRLVLHQGQHDYIYWLQGCDLLDQLEQWLAYYLKDEDVDLASIPTYQVQSNQDQTQWQTFQDWQTSERQVDLPKQGVLAFEDSLEDSVYDYDQDNQDQWLDDLVLGQSTSCLRYTFHLDQPLTIHDIHLSFEAALDQETGILSAMLVDMGQKERITGQKKYIDDRVFELESQTSPYKVISRAWLNVQNRSSWSEKEIIQGFESYELSFIQTYYELPAQHELCLIIYGRDAQYTPRPKGRTQIEVDTDSLSLSLEVLEAQP